MDLKMLSPLIAITIFAPLVWGVETSVQGSISAKGVRTTNFPSLAKISMSAATRIATKKVPGNIVGAALEEEDGFLVYSIEINGRDKAMHEVIVDAGSGKILAKNIESNDPDRAEAESH